MKKPSMKRLAYLIADEKKASKEYASYGFTRLSHDEARHRRFLKKLMTKQKNCPCKKK